MYSFQPINEESGVPNWLWVGAGKGEGFYLQTWRHTCFSLNFNTGRFQLVENGIKRWDGTYDSIVKMGATFNQTATHITVGCSQPGRRMPAIAEGCGRNGWGTA